MTNFTLSPTFDAANASQKAELLLRRLGVRRNLVGFDYTVYMSVQVAANPSSLHHQASLPGNRQAVPYHLNRGGARCPHRNRGLLET